MEIQSSNGSSFLGPNFHDRWRQAGIALVYLVNVVPSLTMKLTGPYWFHYVSYRHHWSDWSPVAAIGGRLEDWLQVFEAFTRSY